ncbi:MAG: hypothetical protein KF905_13515 [Flavobacteriales bacterium]|nr:hypothetical protein [Flavobacteriales bacterium]
MRKHLHMSLLAIGLGAILNSCNTDLLTLRMDEGEVEYALTFPDYDPSGIMAGMLPERTTLSFMNDKQVAEVSAGMGIFRTTLVSDNKARFMDYHMSMMSKKLVSSVQQRDLALFNDGWGVPTILHTGHVDSIAGVPCKRAIAIFDGIDQPEIELWFTDAFAIDSPNWYTPFGEIPGLLMRYDVVQYGMRMRLEAINVKPGKPDPAKFQRKDEFQAVPASVLQHEMAEVMGAFSM